MVTDARGHEVPAGSDPWGYREDMEQFSASIADVRPVADSAEALAAIADLTASDIDPTGTLWWLASPGGLYVYDGATFNALDSRIASGAATANVSGGAVKSMTITFPAGQFTKAPAVVAGAQSANAFSRAASANLITETSFQLNLAKAEGAASGALTASWIAAQGGLPAVTLQLRTFAAEAATPQYATVTCPTDGCLNQGISIRIPSSWVDDDGATQTVDDVACGVCGTDITDTLHPIEGS